MIGTWQNTWNGYPEQTNQKSRVLSSGSAYPKTLAPRTSTEWRNIFSTNSTNYRRLKINRKDDVESRSKFCERVEWTDSPLTEAVNEAFEGILVEKHNIFARLTTKIGYCDEYGIWRWPGTKNYKIVYKHSLPLLIHLKADLSFELVPLNKHGLTTIIFFPSTKVQIFLIGKPTDN